MATTGTARPYLRLLAGGALAVVAMTTATLAGEPPPAAAMPLSETTSLLTAIAKVTGSLIVVIGLMLLLLHVIKRTGLGSGQTRNGSAITVLETRMVAPKKYITIVEIAGQCLALGVTDHAITRLADLGPEAMARLTSPSAQANPAASFAGLLHRSMQAWRQAPPPAEGVAPRSNHENKTEDAP